MCVLNLHIVITKIYINKEQRGSASARNHRCCINSNEGALWAGRRRRDGWLVGLGWRGDGGCIDRRRSLGRCRERERGRAPPCAPPIDTLHVYIYSSARADCCRCSLESHVVVWRRSPLSPDAPRAPLPPWHSRPPHFRSITGGAHTRARRAAAKTNRFEWNFWGGAQRHKKWAISDPGVKFFHTKERMNCNKWGSFDSSCSEWCYI